MKYLIGWAIGILLLVWGFSLCSPAHGNSTGHEYMPDMAHAVSYEANQYSNYFWNTWDSKNQFSKAQLSQPRKKVNGTIPRGYTAAFYGQDMGYVHGQNAGNAISTPVNGDVPFYYANTEEDRVKCEAELTHNPFVITKTGLEKAKANYEIYCGVCHGKKGDGQSDMSGYPVAAKNFLGDDMIAAGNGRYYFAMMYGKNVMGSYADKLSFEERWQVIHYIRSLQAKSKNLEYNEKKNTLNNPLLNTPEGFTAIEQKAAAPAPKH